MELRACSAPQCGCHPALHDTAAPENRMPPTYLQWNDMLAKYFFSEEKAGREVLLYVNDPLIEALGAPHGAELPEFVEAVRAGPPWTTGSGICQKALQTLERWRQRGLDYPPYIAYLALFVVAAGKEGEYAPHAYYPRLRDLLGEPGETRAPSSFDRMIDLWDDLEKWSREDQHENLGRFVARIWGGWWKVGLPLSQTLISEDERKHLPLLLSDRGLDPSDLPSPEVVLRILRQTGASLFERRTLRVLDGEDRDSAVLRSALVDVVIEELEAWDGGTVEDTPHGTRATLRLCLKHDQLAQRVTCRVRMRTAATLPDDGCTFVREGGTSSWVCEELFGGWSSTLHDPDADPLQELDGTKLEWKNGERLVDDESQWIATLRAAPTRVFTPGRHEGLPDTVERQRLERNTPFLIAATDLDADTIRQWGNEHCSNFREHGNSGLPDGWTLFSGDDARHSCPGVDVLTISSTIRLLVRGGVKTGRGNSYLMGAPPYILLENGLGTETVTLDEEQLERDEEHHQMWHIPEEAPAGMPLRIEAQTQEQTLKKVIRLEDPHLPLHQDYADFRRGPVGIPTRSEHYARGAVAHHQPERQSPYPRGLPLHLSPHVILIGATPGQIAAWPDEDLPTWDPVWAIVKVGRRKLEAVFCGTEVQASRPYSKPVPVKEKALVRRWKEAIWHHRKRIHPPQLGALEERWQEYMEVARHVR